MSTTATEAVERLGKLLDRPPSALDATQTLRGARGGQLAVVSVDVLNRVCDELERSRQLHADCIGWIRQYEYPREWDGMPNRSKGSTDALKKLVTRLALAK